MGERGPIPTPTALKIAAGNPGKRPLHEEEEPKPRFADLSVPSSWLPEVGKEEWLRVVEFMPENVISGVDVTALEAYCAAYARARDAEERLQEVGDPVITTEKGYRLPHPLVAIRRNAWQDAIKYAKELGFTPAARVNVKVLPDGPTKGKSDPLARIISGPPPQV